MENKVKRLSEDKSAGVIILLGPSRAGKTTVSTAIVEEQAKKHGRLFSYLSEDVIVQLCMQYLPELKINHQNREESGEKLAKPILSIASMFHGNPNCPNICLDCSKITVENLDTAAEEIFQETGFDPRSIIKVYCLGYPDVTPEEAVANIQKYDEAKRDWSYNATTDSLMKEVSYYITKARENKYYIKSHGKSIRDNGKNNEPWVEFVNVGSGIERPFALRKCIKNINTHINTHSMQAETEPKKQTIMDTYKSFIDKTKTQYSNIKLDIGLDELRQQVMQNELFKKALYTVYQGVKATNEKLAE